MPHSSRGRLAVDTGGAWRTYWGNSPLPPGAQALGTVTRGEGDTGALIRTGAGLYVQGNARVLRSLDQRKIEAALEQAQPGHGGFRPGSGRRAEDGTCGMVRKNVTLDEASIDRLRTLGGGDLSLGIRRAAATLPPGR